MTRFTAGAVLAVAAALALWLGLAGADFMSTLERPDPPIAPVSTPGDPGTPRLARRVYLVILDGLGRDRSSLPFLDELRRRGVDVGATTHYPTWSRPNYISILTGVPPAASGIRTNYHPMSLRLDSIAARVRAAKLRVAWISNYPVIPPLFLGPGVVALDGLEFGDERLGSPAGLSWPFDDVRREPTPAEVARVIPELDDDLVVIALGDIDRAGHMSGAASDAYRDASRDVDRALATAFAHVDPRDAIIVVADHGHVDAGGHGGLEPEVVRVPLIAAGAGVRVASPAIPADAQLIDVAPTIAALLGVPAPQQALGRTLTGILDLDDISARRRLAADHSRVVPIQQLLDADADVEADAIAAKQRWRIPLLVLALAGFVVVGRRLAIRPRLAPIAAIAVAITVIAFAVMVRGSLSPSAVPPKAALITRIVVFSIAGVLAQVAVSAWRCRDVAAATWVAWLGLAVALAPICVLLAVAPRADVPSPAMLVAIPGLEIAGAAGCAAVALSLVVALVRSR